MIYGFVLLTILLPCETSAQNPNLKNRLRDTGKEK